MRDRASGLLARANGAVIASVMVALAGGVAVGQSDSVESVRVDQGSSAVWLSVRDEGMVALVDAAAPSQAAVATVRVAGPGSPVEVIQDGGGALVLDPRSRAVTRIDGATGRPHQAASIFAPDQVRPQVGGGRRW